MKVLSFVFSILLAITNVKSLLGHGFQYHPETETKEQLWSIICQSHNNGLEFGKLNGNGDAFFSADGILYRCTEYEISGGKHIENDGVNIPSECEKRKQIDSKGVTYYPAVVQSRHGKIPGKAFSPQEAYFGYSGIQQKRRKFVWLC